MQIPYINIHRHGAEMPGEFGIENIYKNFDQLPISHFSAGLHPWYIDAETWPQEFARLKNISNEAAMVAVGECGLDKVCTTDFDLQKKVFLAQAALANELGKPLIIHCVRAHDEVIRCLEMAGNKMPAIFHGFNKSREVAERLLSKGYYLSFGKSLQTPHMQPIYASLPPDRIFLETDDAIIRIQDLYTIAAGLRGITVEALSLQLKQNVQTVFNISV